jgi:hypothetical protein
VKNTIVILNITWTLLWEHTCPSSLYFSPQIAAIVMPRELSFVVYIEVRSRSTRFPGFFRPSRRTTRIPSCLVGGAVCRRLPLPRGDTADLLGCWYVEKNKGPQTKCSFRCARAGCLLAGSPARGLYLPIAASGSP